MIAKIKFKTGSSQQALPLEIEVAPITVFVGPNNSGKSQVLIELQDWSVNGQAQAATITEEVFFNPLSRDEVAQALRFPLVIDEEAHNLTTVSIRSMFGQSSGTNVSLSDLLQTAAQPNIFRGYTSYAQLRGAYTLRLDGQTRLNLIREVGAGDFQSSTPENAIARLFRENALREQVRQVIHDALGKYFVIDPTKSGSLRVKFSERAPVDENEERSFTDAAIAFHRAATAVEGVSDGIKAFTGIITALFASDPKIILIDEPEAFLHPALAMKLGKEIGKTINDSAKRLFIATHSASFIMGCIQSGSPIDIVRLTYKGGIGTTRVLDRNKLLHLMRNPLLRSTGVIEGLFYEAVIVTESAADRAFYQEVNERLRSANDPRGISNCLFLNAQNKQTVWDIVKPLRELGIPTVGIIDLDMVKDGGADFSKIIEGAFVPPLQHHPMSDMRDRIKRALDSSVPVGIPVGDVTKNWWKRNGGVDILNSGDKQAANSYFDQFEAYGVFIVRSGELESWLKDLGVPANKKRWLYDIFVAMGEDPTLPAYINPGQGDVWDFVGRIKQWMDNPTRYGIPD